MPLNTLAYFNHGGLALETALDEACIKLIEKRPLKDITNWQHSCRCAVLHGTPDGLIYNGECVKDAYNYFSKQDVASADGLVVIFVSSVEVNDRAKVVAFRDGAGKSSVRFLLPIRRTVQAGLTALPNDKDAVGSAAAKWRALLQDALDQNTLEKWFANPETRGISQALDDVLRESRGYELLSALAILCQGYLAVQATPLPEENADSAQVWKALIRMGWTEFIRRPESKAVCQDLTEQKEEVKKQAWWREAIVGTRADVKKQLCNELRQNELPAELESLIDEIIPSGSQTDSKGELETVQPMTVSAAYLVLADRLEATA